MMTDPSYYHEPAAHYLQKNKQSANLVSLKHSTALSSSAVNPISSQISFAPPQPLLSYISPQKPPDVQHPLSNQQQYNSLPTFIPPPPTAAAIAVANQIPPQLPKKTRPKNFRPNSSGALPSSSTLNSNLDKHHTCNSKRKSAVELLAESKAYYVKSEVVLDRKQKLNYQNLRSSCGTISGQISPSHTFPHQRAHTLNNRKSANSELLQMKLRRLINDPSVPKESDSYSINANKSNDNYYHRPIYDLEDTKFEPPKQFSSNKRLTQEVNKDFFSEQRTPKKNVATKCFFLFSQLTIHPVIDPNIDTAVMFPSAFLSPQSLPPHNTISDDDMYDYCDDKNSSILINDYQPISPPAEYAEFGNSPVMQQSTKRDNR